MKIQKMKHINSQCLDFGITFNWNVHLSVEINFLVWSVELIFCRTPKLLKNIRLFNTKDQKRFIPKSRIMQDAIIKDRVEMIVSLLKSVDKAGGKISWNRLKNLTVGQLVDSLAHNGVRFVYEESHIQKYEVPGE